MRAYEVLGARNCHLQLEPPSFVPFLRALVFSDGTPPMAKLSRKFSGNLWKFCKFTKTFSSTSFSGMCEEYKTLVIDNGSSSIKAGYGGEEAPESVFPSVVGRPRFATQRTFLTGTKGTCTGYEACVDTYIGHEACAKAGVLTLKYPIHGGIVINWEDMEKIWHHTFYNELRVDPAEHPVLCTEPPHNVRCNRERMAQVMFETFSVPSFYVGVKSVLSIFGHGAVTGLVVDVGEDRTYVVPVYEGHSVEHATYLETVGGRDIANYLNLMLTERGYFFNSSSGKEIIREMMRRVAYVAIDFDDEERKSKMSSECIWDYTLPDGNVLTLDSERFRCTEILFKPWLVDTNAFMGIHHTAFDSIMKCDYDIRNDIYGHIFLTGGATMFDGLQERFEKEIRDLVRPTRSLRVVAGPERKYSSWIGGSILSSMETFPQMVITREEYDEHGQWFVHRRCL